MARLTRKPAGYCHDCGTKIRNPAEHRSTAKHRDALYARMRDTAGPIDDRADFAQRMRLARSTDDGTAEQNAEAALRLQLGDQWFSTFADDDPDANDTYMPEPEPIRLAKGLEPCPRCGRNDWRSKRGRAYHVDENPDCLRWRKPERHTYVMAPA